MHRRLSFLAVWMAAGTAWAAEEPAKIYLSEQAHRILFSQQGWGDLGLNTCAFQRGIKPEPMTIADKRYKKGIGTHAPGEMIVELGGEFALFEAEVGLQNLTSGPGSVVFKVLVDDQQKFDSGLMKSGDKAKPVSIPVEGAMEMRLVVTDGGDGLTCDCANWAEARLVRSKTPKKLGPGTVLDVAPYADVVTCDPQRFDGARAGRIEEYHADDVFLEVPAEKAGDAYKATEYDGTACIGLRWLERRLVRDLGITFDQPAPPKFGIQVHAWVGESLWQGKWVQLYGTLAQEGSSLRFAIDWSRTPEARSGTRKIRWLLPPGERRVTKLSAITPTPLDTVNLRIAVEKPMTGRTAHIAAYNGLLARDGQDLVATDWQIDQPLAMDVKYARPRPWKTDRTALRFSTPAGSFAVAIDDVIKNGGVYVRSAGVFVSRGDMNRDAQGYLANIKDRKTVLQRVREMPDQTLAQAIEHVHNPKQNVQPMLLSLACDNQKYISHRDGTILFTGTPDKADQMVIYPLKYEASLHPVFGSGKLPKLKRYLDGGWLPAPVTEVEEDGVLYRQRTFVAPAGEGSACVVEFSARPLDDNAPKSGTIELRFVANTEKNEPADQVTPMEVRHKGRLLARSGGIDARLNVQQAGPGSIRITWNGMMDRSVVYRIYLPGDAPEVPGPDFDRFLAYWRDVMAPTLQVDLPDPLLANVIRASQVHCLLAARNEDDGKRIAPWIASMVYGPLESESNSIVRGMDYFGHHDFSRKSLDFFINKYKPDGLLTTGYTLMGTGWHLWSVGEHHRLTHDKAWVTANADKIASVCDWILRQRAKTRKELPTGRPPEYGLAPPGVMADWNAYAYYFCLNGYYYKGLREAATALKSAGFARADEMLREADAYREDILKAYHWAQARMPVYPLKDGTSVPGYPSQLTAPGPTNNFFPGEDGNRSWCYDVELGAHHLVPQEVLDANSREVGDLMDHMEDVQFLAEGWFDFPAERNEKDWYNCGGFAKVQPYYCRNSEIYALRDDVKPFVRSYFNTIPSLLGFETLSFQEHFAGVAAWNKTHETGYFLLYSRLMLVQERGDDLWLAPFVTTDWLRDGKTIAVRNAPTRFGVTSYEIRSKAATNQIEVDLVPPDREPPKRIVIRLRHPEGKPIARVTLREGTADATVDPKSPGEVILQKAASKVKLTVEY